ncbi:polyamine aminopropyltransferase [Mesorhizobium sp. M1406]|uniref:polyamine aminopropyltransferase n=1 Tax=Mesorhizobium sp. M1406 TaxID=2957099 RepID=UPI003339537F
MTQKHYVSETLIDGIRVSFEAERTLHEDVTSHHRMELIENRVFGKVLLLDGAVQVTSADEFMYHEMMAHVPILAHDDPRDVLIVGGGDCGLAEEVLKHRRVRSLTQVEIDPNVLDFSHKHFGEFNASVFRDERFQIEIADGAAFVRETMARFDVILVDSTDPVGPGAALFTPAFYRDLHRCLRPDGIAVTQSGVPFLQKEDFVASIRGLGAAFDVATCYIVAVPTYFGGHLALGWASDTASLLEVDPDILRERAAGLATRYYTPAIHRASFVLPGYIAEAVEQADRGR